MPGIRTLSLMECPLLGDYRKRAWVSEGILFECIGPFLAWVGFGRSEPEGPGPDPRLPGRVSGAPRRLGSKMLCSPPRKQEDPKNGMRSCQKPFYSLLTHCQGAAWPQALQGSAGPLGTCPRSLITHSHGAASSQTEGRGELCIKQTGMVECLQSFSEGCGITPPLSCHTELARSPD